MQYVQYNMAKELKTIRNVPWVHTDERQKHVFLIKKKFQRLSRIPFP